MGSFYLVSLKKGLGTSGPVCLHTQLMGQQHRHLLPFLIESLPPSIYSSRIIAQGSFSAHRHFFCWVSVYIIFLQLVLGMCELVYLYTPSYTIVHPKQDNIAMLLKCVTIQGMPLFSFFYFESITRQSCG